MGTKVVVDEIDNLNNNSGLATLNENLQKLADEFDKILYRDGSQTVQGNVDADSKRVLNLPDAVSGGEPVPLRQAGIYADAVAALQNWYPTKEEGEAATTEGEFFSYPDGVGGLVYAERLAVGSEIFSEAATKALVDTKVSIANLASTGGAELVGLSLGGTLADAVKYVTPQMFGAIGDGVTDDTAAVDSAFNSGASVVVPPGEYLITSQITATPSDIEIICEGFLVFDWEALGAVDVITFSGDNLQTKLKAKAKDSAYVLANTATLQAKYCFAFTGDNCSCRAGHTENNPGFVKAAKSGGRFSFTGNWGFSVVSGLVADSTDIVMFYYYDGEGGEVIGNRGYGFGHGILFGLSTNNCTVSGNDFWDCGNHCIYISSGNQNTITGNTARGDYTDIKARGDYNVIAGNNIIGGSLIATNAVADTGNGNAINSLVINGNSILCNRALSIPLSAGFRTSFDGNAAGISVTNNTIRLGVDATYAILVNYASLVNINISGNNISVESGFSPADAIWVGTTGGTVNGSRDITISNNVIETATAQAIQVTGDKVVISGNAAKTTGAGQTVVVVGDAPIVSGNRFERTTNGVAVLCNSGTNARVDGNLLMQPSGDVTSAISGSTTNISRFSNTILAGTTPKESNYTDGSWTVRLYDAASGGNQSATTATGTYTKVGRVVTATFQLANISTAGMTGANDLYIELPLASANITGNAAAGSVVLDGVTLPAGTSLVNLALNANSSRARLIASGSATGDANVTVSALTSGASDIVFASITYLAS